MKQQFFAAVLSGFAAFSLASCARNSQTSPKSSASIVSETSSAVSVADNAVSLNSTANSANSEPDIKFERKIIKTAKITLEASAPEETQNKISSLLESKKGYIVKTDTREQNVGEQSRKTVTMVVRVPVENFEETLRELKQQGIDRVVSESVSGEDVTEQFVDTEARLKAKKAVEAQYLEVLKQARTVTDTLEVQEKLGEVRSEIESFEGRLRLLQNQTAFSTINIEIQPTAAIGGNMRGFGYEIRSAFSDGIDTAGAVLLMLLRLSIILLPLFLVFGVPFYLFVKWLKHRRKRILNAEEIK